VSCLSRLLQDRRGIPIGIGARVDPEPEIPTAMDDWDEAFKAATGAYPPFSRLVLEPLIQARAAMRYTNPYSAMAHGIADGGYERAYQSQLQHEQQRALLARMHQLGNPGLAPTRKVPPA
jgi:hypothetical protein